MLQKYGHPLLTARVDRDGVEYKDVCVCVRALVRGVRLIAFCYWLLFEVANTVDRKFTSGAVVMGVQKRLLASGNAVATVCKNNLGN
jgi:hypothetical protein